MHNSFSLNTRWLRFFLVTFPLDTKIQKSYLHVVRVRQIIININKQHIYTGNNRPLFMNIAYINYKNLKTFFWQSGIM